MSEPILNYVRCPHCEGNAAIIGHPCDEAKRQAAADEAFARFMAAVKAPPEKATAEQLRVKLAECEEALTATEIAFGSACAELEAERAETAKLRDELRSLGIDTLQLGRDWRSGKVVNIGPYITALSERARTLADPPQRFTVEPGIGFITEDERERDA